MQFVVFYVYIIYMPSKCYIVDYDNKINQYKQLLNQIPTSYYDDEVKNTHMTDQYELKNNLIDIENYLDEMLQTPGMSDEDMYNLRKDQNDILEMTDDLSKNIHNLEKSVHSCCDESETKNISGNISVNENDSKNNNNKNNNEPGTDATPNITININSGEKKNSFYTHRKINPQKIKI